MSSANRFVAYAFCVGDVFLELDGDLRLTHAEGALEWLGMSDPAKVTGQLLTDFLAKSDREVINDLKDMLSDSGRVGPLRVSMGAGSRYRRPVAIFLSRLTETGPIHGVVLAAGRLQGAAKDAEPLPDSDSFFRQLPDLLANSADNGNLAVSLMRLANGESPANPDLFARHLAAVSLGGRSAADLGKGRYVVVLESSDGEDGADKIAQHLAAVTGEQLEAATISAEDTENAGGDMVRALVYSVRRFAEANEPPDLKALSRNFADNLDMIREKIGSLRTLLSNRRFSLAFQPIVSLKTRRIHHVESLVRFDMRGGSPYELITFAEDVDLIAELDSAIVERVIKRLRSLAKKGAPARLAVNLSARSLTSPPFQEKFRKLLSDNSLLCGRLMIEVTESAQIGNLAALGEAVEMIKGEGFSVCLDDFGAGASGFQYLNNLKVDFVKIDGSYVRSAVDDAKQRAFLHSMITLCRDLRIKTIGEWVETERQADLLKDLGVEMGQGYLYGRPSMTLPKSIIEPSRASQSSKAPPEGWVASG